MRASRVTSATGGGGNEGALHFGAEALDVPGTSGGLTFAAGGGDCGRIVGRNRFDPYGTLLPDDAVVEYVPALSLSLSLSTFPLFCHIPRVLLDFPFR